MKKFSIKTLSLLVCILVAISGSAMLLSSCADDKEETTKEEEEEDEEEDDDDDDDDDDDTTTEMTTSQVGPSTEEVETETADLPIESDIGMPETITPDSIASADLAAIAQSYADQGYVIYSVSAMGVDPEATYVDGFISMPESETSYTMASALIFANAEDAQAALDEAISLEVTEEDIDSVGVIEFTAEDLDGRTVYTASNDMYLMTVTYYPDTFIIETLIEVSATPTISDTLVTEG